MKNRVIPTLIVGLAGAVIGSFVMMLHDYKPDMAYRRFMPPMVGTQQDVDDLTNYLNAKVNPVGQQTVQTAQK